MNKNKLKELVSALDELSDDVKDWGVEMESYDKVIIIALISNSIG
jgi:hypothetical protein